MSKLLFRWVCAVTVIMATYALVPTPTVASHSWSGHWQRTSSAIRYIPVRRFHSSIWLTRFSTAMADWRKSAMTKIRPVQGVTGGGRNPCPATLNQITSCDGSYGNTGWLGLATVWRYVSGGHIAQGTSKVNNTYFTKSPYNTVAYRQFVICQEIGHNFGLGHVNEVFNNANTGSCMDYTNDPDGGAGGGSSSDPNNMHPNAHDYALVNTRHNHIGSILPGLAPQKDVKMSAAVASYSPMRISEMGRLVHRSTGGHLEQYEMNFGNGIVATNLVIRAR